MASVFQSIFGGGNVGANYGPAIAAEQAGVAKGASYLNQPQYDMISSPYDTGLLAMLGGGGTGGLNSMLQPAYNWGSQQIGQQASGAGAAALSGGQGRGLGNSSIAAQGYNAAQAGGQMSMAQLMSALLGQQYSAQGQAAGTLAGQGEQVANQQQGLMEALANLYAGEGSSLANLYGAQANMDAATTNQNNQMWGNFAKSFGPLALLGGLSAGGAFSGGSGGATPAAK